MSVLPNGDGQPNVSVDCNPEDRKQSNGMVHQAERVVRKFLAGIPGISIDDWRGRGDSTGQSRHFWPHGRLVQIGPSIVFTRRETNPKCESPGLSLNHYRGREWEQHLSTFYDGDQKRPPAAHQTKNYLIEYTRKHTGHDGWFLHD